MVEKVFDFVIASLLFRLCVNLILISIIVDPVEPIPTRSVLAPASGWSVIAWMELFLKVFLWAILFEVPLSLLTLL